jgi:alanine racemase
MALRAVARVNVAAIGRNVSGLCDALQPGTRLCAVVKADGYGHGAAQSARAALAGGASWLAVATAGEAGELRRAGIDAPILVMGAISCEELPVALEARAHVVAWSERFVELLAAAGPACVHVKLDTGMGRLGTREVAEALRIAERIDQSPRLELAGAMTHFATADGDPGFVRAQLERFEPFVAGLRSRWPELLVHAANSAATLTIPESHYDMVRCGIAIYGCDPMNRNPAAWGLEPALELSSYVAAVKTAASGESVGYGRRYVAAADTGIATLPIGYADGIRRALTNNCEVLVRGRRYPLVGTVSMDNVTLEVGSATDVRIGDTATIIGADGGERQTAEELAARIGTINYEIVCGISGRVPREYHRDGERVA